MVVWCWFNHSFALPEAGVRSALGGTPRSQNAIARFIVGVEAMRLDEFYFDERCQT